MTDEERVEHWAARIADGEPIAEAVDAPRGVRRLSDVATVIRSAGVTPPGGEPELFTWGPLRVRRRLAAGGFGEVFAAWDPTLQREVALKLRRDDDPEGARRWITEARRLARVRHANVLHVLGADEHDGRAGLWTDLVQGRTLEDVLAGGARWSAREAAAAGLELCAALAAVHAAGLVHGDVKTRNVMIEDGPLASSPGRLVLMDFGSAHESVLAQTAGRGSSAGTPLVLAPEVLRGEPVTPAADVYALGVLLYRMLTGRYPVEATTLAELRDQHDRAARVPLRSRRPDLPAPLVRAIEDALAPEPSRRLASAAAFEQALLAAQPAAVRRRGWPVQLVIGALAAGAAFAAWRAWPPARPARAPAPAAAPARPAAAAALRADATLFRVRGRESAPLADGGSVAPGDRLWLEVRADEAAWVYVLNEDASGHVFALFPLAIADVANPLPAARAIRLPGRVHGQPLTWQVNSADGRESFAVIASRRPLAALEQLLRVTAAPSPDRPMESDDVASRLPDDLRGVDGLATGAVPEPRRHPGRLRAVYEKTLSNGGPGLWGRWIEVSNPPR